MEKLFVFGLMFLGLGFLFGLGFFLGLDLLAGFFCFLLDFFGCGLLLPDPAGLVIANAFRGVAIGQFDGIEVARQSS